MRFAIASRAPTVLRTRFSIALSAIRAFLSFSHLSKSPSPVLDGSGPESLAYATGVAAIARQAAEKRFGIAGEILQNAQPGPQGVYGDPIFRTDLAQKLDELSLAYT
jgi:hypothetical protein